MNDILKYIRRLYREVDRILNPPTYIGPTKVRVRSRFEGDKTTRRYIERAQTVRFYFMIVFAFLALILIQVKIIMGGIL